MVRLWVGGGPPLVARPPYRVRGGTGGSQGGVYLVGIRIRRVTPDDYRFFFAVLMSLVSEYVSGAR